MRTITLIRHSQASFGAENYDKLSDLGLAQCDLIGNAFKERNFPTSEEEVRVVWGGQERHKETMEGVLKFWPYQGPVLKEERLGEFDHMDIIFKGEEGFKPKAKIGIKLLFSRNKDQTIERTFLKTLTRWVSGDFENEYKEPFSKFHKRTWEGLIEASDKFKDKKSIFIFTSGGVIASILLKVLKIEKENFIPLVWSLYNGSLTQLKIRPNLKKELSYEGDFFLSSFNEHHHMLGKGSEFLTNK